MIDLALIWAGLLSFAILAYVVLDGFDLGVGILFGVVGNKRDRDTMVNTIAPVWDGNETWLVLGGGGLFAAFPLAYAILMPALYAPLFAMLLALVFRGVAFEFRFRSIRHKRWWDVGFCGGSVVAAFSQGVALGAFIQGIAVDGRAYAGGWFDWLSLFSIATGLALVAGYALLGATWLIMKTGGPLQQQMRRAALPLTAIVLAAIGGVSLWTPLLHDDIAARWFEWPNIAFLSPMPIAIAAIAAFMVRALMKQRDAMPFLLALALFVLSFIGLGISLYPFAVPRAITIWEAAAPDASLGLLLVGAVILIPIILAYTAYAYWVFRGKVDPDEGYH